MTFRGFLGATEVVSQVVQGDDAGVVNFVGFTGLDRVTVNVAGIFQDPIMDNLVYEVSVVPEPPTLALLGAGLLGLGLLRRRHVG